MMRRLSSVTLVTLLLLQTLALNYVPEVDAATAKGGSKDDFSIFSIEVGNQTIPTEKWIQPGGEVIDYLLQDDFIEVKVTVYKDGATTGVQKQTDALLEIVHPIGFVIESFGWTTGLMAGGAKDATTISWNPQEAHSVLDTSTNELTGGLILRASVNFTADDRNDNDIMEKQVPIAVYKDIFDGEASGTSLTFRPARYPIGGGDANDFGSWYEDNTDATTGSSHWRMSLPGGNTYPSSAFDRLVHSYKNPDNNCNGDQLDSGLTNIEQAWVCREIFQAQNYISSQIHLQAWGTMGAGDAAYLELWNNNGNFSDPLQSVHWDVAEINPSPVPGQWKNISWDPQTVWSQNPSLANPDLFLGGNSWTFGLVFRSDSSGATQGMHFDDFVQFGISKVDGFTLTADCDNPAGGFETVPNDLVSWKCLVTNNGYKNVQFRAQTNVTNSSWMDPTVPQLRLDTTNPNDNDFNVVIPPIGPFETTEVWANLSIPVGADVQIQDWEIWFTDASSANTGEKARVSTTVSIDSQYSVRLNSNANQIALTMNPGETANLPFQITNTGNLDSTFELRSTFNAELWSGTIQDDVGNAITSIFMEKGTSADLSLSISAEQQATPGQISVEIRATRTSGNVVGDTTLNRLIDVPIYRDSNLEVDYSSPYFSTDESGLPVVVGYANGEEKMLRMTLFNNGNDEESFNLTVANNFPIYFRQTGASVDNLQSPLLDEWGGSWSFFLNLPMPVGLPEGFYEVTVTATNVDDSSLVVSQVVSVEVKKTASVHVETDISDQSYIPGDLAQSMTFEVTNNGNIQDTFEMSLNLPQGMNAQFTNLVDGSKTVPINSGASYNVTVEFSFVEGTSGNLQMVIVAKSMFDATVIATGGSTYSVGSTNELLKILPSQLVIIDDFEDEVTLEVTVRNQYSTSQSVSMDISSGNSSSWFQSRIDSNDRQFVLGTGDDSIRVITITFQVTESTLMTLDQPTFDSEITLWARSDTVSDAAQSEIQVQLRKIIIETNDDQGSSFDLTGAAMWFGFVLVMVAGIVIAIRILKNVEDEDDEYANWGQEGYQDSITATYQSVLSAPTVPSGPPATVPSSMPPQSAPPASVPSSMPPQSAPPTQSATSAPSQPSGPPLPATGLPAGWTMEQWGAYGAQWLEQNDQIQ
ncbi:MAG: hypothetical protein P8Q94_07555 [Candidatus Poseidoniaceae archaeon]|nr:hypothetical protein [Candidatus Poseidoniaceae archaeon]